MGDLTKIILYIFGFHQPSFIFLYSHHLNAVPLTASMLLVICLLDILLVEMMNRMILKWKLTPPKKQFFFISLFIIFDRSVKLPSSNFLYSTFSKALAHAYNTMSRRQQPTILEEACWLLVFKRHLYPIILPSYSHICCDSLHFMDISKVWKWKLHADKCGKDLG